MIKIAQISRMNSYERLNAIRVDWLDEFVDNFYKDSSDKEKTKESKTIVEIGRERGNDAVYQSISAMLGVKNSVEGRVQELQDQIGLKTYLNRISEQNKDSKISQAEQTDISQSVFSGVAPEVANDVISYIVQYISSNNGHIHVPAIKENVRRLFARNGISQSTLENPAFNRFVQQLINEHRSSSFVSDSNLGKSDHNDLNNAISENNDFFRNFLPRT